MNFLIGKKIAGIIKVLIGGVLSIIGIFYFFAAVYFSSNLLFSVIPLSMGALIELSGGVDRSNVGVFSVFGASLLLSVFVLSLFAGGTFACITIFWGLLIDPEGIVELFLWASFILEEACLFCVCLGGVKIEKH